MIDDMKSRLFSLWKEVHSKLQHNYYSDLEEAIRELGKTDKCNDMSEYLFVSLWCPNYLLYLPDPKNEISNNNRQVRLCANHQGIQDICNEILKSNDQSSDICFKLFCYEWVINNKLYSNNSQ